MAAETSWLNDRKSVTLRVSGNDDAVIVTARGGARELAREMGFGVVDQTRIATAVSEIVRNVVLYAGVGEVTFGVARSIDGTVGMEIVVCDEGPGIADVAQVLEGGRSTSRGFGCGIRGSREMMDDFELTSVPGRGTSVKMRKWLD